MMIPMQGLLLTQLEVVLGCCALLASNAARQSTLLSWMAWSGLTVGVVVLLQLSAPVAAVKAWQSGLAALRSTAHVATLACKRALSAMPQWLSMVLLCSFCFILGTVVG